jgi:hypothetical protein
MALPSIPDPGFAPVKSNRYLDKQVFSWKQRFVGGFTIVYGIGALLVG